MRLTLPMSDHEKQALMQDAAHALRFGRLYAVREESRADGTLSVSAKYADSFGFVKHPRLTTRQSGGELLDFRCDCIDFRKTGRLCCHCMALADEYFDEILPFGADTILTEAPAEAPGEPALIPEDPTPSPVEQISYRFCNSRRDLYPGKDAPRIPLIRYYQMFGKNAYARQLYARHKGWGGSCFGFTTTASMFATPADPMCAPDFKVDAAYPADLSLTSRNGQLHMTLHTLLESMQILQYSNPLIQHPRHSHLADPNCLDNLCSRVLHFQQTRTDPVAMGVARNPRFEGCHSVYPYWLEVNPDGQDRLHIYDPNHPMKTRYATLEKDGDGHYTDWRFPMNEQNEYVGSNGGQLFFDDYSDYKGAWDQRGCAPIDAMMSVPRKVAIANMAGDVLFRVTDEGTQAFCDDIYEMIMTDLGEESGDQVLLCLPAGRYLVRNEDPQRESIQIMLTHTQQSVTIRTTASEVVLTADDAAMTVSAQIDQSEHSYGIELDAVYEEDSRVILLEGTTAVGGLTFGCYDGILRVAGILSEELASLYIDEELSDLTCIEPLQLEIPEPEPAPLKTHIQILCSEQAEDHHDADVTD